MPAMADQSDRGGALRASMLLAGFLGMTLPLMPVQAALLVASPRHARTFPYWYHQRVCRLLGVRVHVDGKVERERPVLLVSNHVSWLDIPVLSAVAPLSFVAKKEVGGWPLVAQLARLQRTVFVDRNRRTAVGETANEMLVRLRRGDALVLFAEGTSSDGNRVLPFKTSLFAAAKPSRALTGSEASGQPSAGGDADAALDRAVVQTVAIAYTHLRGLPLARADRPKVSWYGDMDMAGHAWELLKAGPLDVRVKIGEPVALSAFADRKALAMQSEAQVRAAVAGLLRG